MRVHLITVGDELLLGDTVNTNASWLGQRLTEADLSVEEVVVVPDRVEAIKDALVRALPLSDIVLVTGGLGPTHDDVTRIAVSEALDKPLHFSDEWFAVVSDRFASRGRTIPEANRTQAEVPDGFEVMPNDFGTAPGLLGVVDQGGRGVHVVVLPGVPREMKHLVEDRLLPRLGRRGDVSRHVIHLGTAGIGESHLQERLGDLSAYLSDGTTLAYLPSLTGLRLRITGTGSDASKARARAEALVAAIDERAGRFIYTHRGETLEAAVGEMLAAAGLTVAVAESCTGGRVADRLTDVPGSSRYVLGGVVAYSNSTKVAALGVREEALAESGSVSEIVAREMAEGVRTRLGADIGLSSTGVLGPGGGTPEKPVGLVWIAIADETGTEARRLTLGVGREDNKMRASTAVLDLLRLRLRRPRGPAQ